MRNLKPETSKKNPYHISRHRMYELEHFCLQYKDWKKLYLDSELYLGNSNLDKIKSKTNNISDPTADLAIKRSKWSNNMKMIEDTANRADEEIGNYIFIAVTEDIRYETLKARLNIPCGREMFYDRRRRFFWLLDQVR